MNKTYYLAYGSNLSVEQMERRCPEATYIGASILPNYHLLFKGSGTGSYLTVEKKKGSIVPVLVWEISSHDEFSLDRYEGYPSFYYKKWIPVHMQSLYDNQELGKIRGLIYVMHEERTCGCPYFSYYKTCLEGYERFEFDPGILRQALIDSIGKSNTDVFLENFQKY